MGWQSVFICDDHWQEEEGKRLPVRLLPQGVELVTEPCYRCGTEACIPVRRLIPNVEAVQDGGTCSHCDGEGVVRINGTWLCLDHLDVGFKEALGPVKDIPLTAAYQEAFGVTPDDAT